MRDKGTWMPILISAYGSLSPLTMYMTRILPRKMCMNAQLNLQYGQLWRAIMLLF